MEPYPTEYRETVQLDSFGDMTPDEFDTFLARYKRAAAQEFPEAEINITVSETVGCPIGENRLIWSDGEEEDLSVYSDRLFSRALNMED